MKQYTLLHYEESKKSRTSRNSTNHSSDIDFDEFERLYRNFQLISYLVVDTTFPSDNALHFQHNLLQEV